MTSRECLIVGAAPTPGSDPFYRALLGDYRLVVAADAAGEWCAGLGRVPDVVVGDFDSSAPGAAGRLRAMGARVAEIPAVKDVTDLEAALDVARGMSPEAVDFCAAFEGRIDHTLAAVGTVMRAADLRAGVQEPTWSGWVLDGALRPRLDLDLPPGTLLSVLATSTAEGVTIDGASYPLTDALLGPLSGLGVSNVAGERGRVSIAVSRGTLLVIAPR